MFNWLLIAIGISAPIFFMVREFTTHQISGCMFDPMPTPWHAALLGLIPAVLLFVIAVTLRKDQRLIIPARFLLGFTLAPILLYVVAIGADYYSASLWLTLEVYYASLPQAKGEMDTYDCRFNALAAFAPLMALIAWWLVARRLSRVETISSRRSIRAKSIGFLIGVVLLGALELPALLIQRRLVQAITGIPTGSRVGSVNSLRTQQARGLLARLCHAPMQFSSDGRLYAVGPVDVFGPLTHICDGFSDPVEAGNHLVGNTVKLRQLFDRLFPREEPIARSWRGLSPWELWDPAK